MRQLGVHVLDARACGTRPDRRRRHRRRARAWRAKRQLAVDGLDDGAVIDVRDRDHRPVGTECDRSVVHSELDRERIDNACIGVEPVPGSGAERAHGQQSGASRRRAFGEERGLSRRLRQHLQRSRRFCQVKGVDLVSRAASDAETEVVRVGDQADRAFARRVHRRGDRIDGAGERIDAKQPVIGDNTRRGPSLWWPVVVDREVEDGVVETGRRAPDRAGDSKCAPGGQRSHDRRLPIGRVEHADAGGRGVSDQPLAHSACRCRGRARRRCARAAAARGQQEAGKEGHWFAHAKPRS